MIRFLPSVSLGQQLKVVFGEQVPLLYRMIAAKEACFNEGDSHYRTETTRALEEFVDNRDFSSLTRRLMPLPSETENIDYGPRYLIGASRFYGDDPRSVAAATIYHGMMQRPSDFPDNNKEAFWPKVVLRFAERLGIGHFLVASFAYDVFMGYDGCDDIPSIR